MAIILPASNPVAGSNPSGTSAGLNYIGNHVYGNSGAVIATNGGDGTLFEFSTGSAYVIVKFAFGMSNTNVSPNKVYGYKLSINNETILENVSISDGDGTMVFDGASVVQSIFLPSYSTIKIESTTTDTDNMTTYGILTGRSYA
jgi:hypothetical protein|tara:strand:- start:253 stop:684 length:432 start_codon:yes stop_codon:yes gene_type:complete